MSPSRLLRSELRRTFSDDDKVINDYGTQQNTAIAHLLGAVIKSTGTSWLKKSKEDWMPDVQKDGGEWLRDAKLFDEVLTAILHVLLWFHPDAGRDRRGLYYHSTVEDIINEIRSADPSIPLAKRSNRQYAMAKLKNELGELAKRTHPYEQWLKSEPSVCIAMEPTAKRKKK